MRWVWLCASLVGAGLLLTSAHSDARVPTRLVYARTQAATDCPDESALAAAVAARLGYEPFSPWGDQTILATITKNGGVLLGHAELIDHDGIARGSRDVRVAKPECAELILALALAISITLDPLHVDAPAAEPAPPEVTPPPPDARPTEDTPSEPEPVTALAPVAVPSDRVPVRKVSRASVTGHVGAAALASLAVGPHFAIGGRLGLMAKRGRWALGVEAWSTLASTQVAAQGGEVSIRVVSAALTPCLRVVSGLSLCALGSLGSMRAEGSGVADARVKNVLHATAGGRASFAFPLGPTFELVANADLAATLNRPSFQIDGVEAWRPGPVLGLVGIGAAARFF